MTGRAFCIAMLALECVTRAAVVIEIVSFPFVGVMAGFALLAELAFMPFVVIDFPVACVAVRRKFFSGFFSGKRFQPGRVAGVAARLLVLAKKRVVGVLVVIEAALLPFLFVVARLAFFTEAALVPLLFIDFPVTGNTAGRRLGQHIQGG